MNWSVSIERLALERGDTIERKRSRPAAAARFSVSSTDTSKREAPVVAPETAPGMPPAAAPVYDNTVLLLDDSDSDTTEEPQ